MGAIQNSINGAMASVGVASRMMGSGNKMSADQQLKSKHAEMSANQSLIDEYTLKKTNLNRSKHLLEKKGLWTEKHASKLDFAEKMIEFYTNLNNELEGSMRDVLKKEGDK